MSSPLAAADSPSQAGNWSRIASAPSSAMREARSTPTVRSHSSSANEFAYPSVLRSTRSRSAMSSTTEHRKSASADSRQRLVVWLATSRASGSIGNVTSSPRTSTMSPSPSCARATARSDATATRSVAPYATSGCRSTAVAARSNSSCVNGCVADVVRDPSPPLTCNRRDSGVVELPFDECRTPRVAVATRVRGPPFAQDVARRSRPRTASPRRSARSARRRGRRRSRSTATVSVGQHPRSRPNPGSGAVLHVRRSADRRVENLPGQHDVTRSARCSVRGAPAPARNRSRRSTRPSRRAPTPSAGTAPAPPDCWR